MIVTLTLPVQPLQPVHINTDAIAFYNAQTGTVGGNCHITLVSGLSLDVAETPDQVTAAFHGRSTPTQPPAYPYHPDVAALLDHVALLAANGRAPIPAFEIALKQILASGTAIAADLTKLQGHITAHTGPSSVAGKLLNGGFPQTLAYALDWTDKTTPDAYGRNLDRAAAFIRKHI